VFWPAPNIESGLVRIDLYPPRERPAKLWPLIDAAFAQRRKTLRAALSGFYGSGQAAEQALRAANIEPTQRLTLRAALSGFYGSGQAAEQALRAANIEPTQRGEKLSIDDFVRLATVEASLDSSRDHEAEEDNEGATHE